MWFDGSPDHLNTGKEEHRVNIAFRAGPGRQRWEERRTDAWTTRQTPLLALVGTAGQWGSSSPAAAHRFEDRDIPSQVAVRLQANPAEGRPSGGRGASECQVDGRPEPDEAGRSALPSFKQG